MFPTNNPRWEKLNKHTSTQCKRFHFAFQGKINFAFPQATCIHEKTVQYSLIPRTCQLFCQKKYNILETGGEKNLIVLFLWFMLVTWYINMDTWIRALKFRILLGFHWVPFCKYNEAFNGYTYLHYWIN